MHLLLKLGFGGAEAGVVKVVNGLSRRGMQASICSCWPSDGLYDQLLADVRLHQMNRKRAGNDPGFLWTLARLLRRERPDVLHTHGWATLLEGAVAARLAGVPFVIHGEHGTLETKPYQLRVQRLLWHRVNAVTAVSSRLADKLASTVGFPRGRIVTIRNGVDTDRFTPARRRAARETMNVSPDTFVVGAVGRLLPVKDHATLVTALGQLRDRGERFHAVIAGDGPLRDHLADLIRRTGLSDCVRLLGNRADVENVLASLDVFVQSSVSEGLSNTVLEAMATGLPVVATHVGGTDELVREGVTGLLIPASNPERLSAALAQLARDPERRRQMGAAARVRAESEFTIARMVAGYEQLYLDVTARGRRSLSWARPHPHGGR